MPLQRKCILIMALVLAVFFCACAKIPEKKESFLEKEAQKRKENVKQ